MLVAAKYNTISRQYETRTLSKIRSEIDLNDYD